MLMSFKNSNVTDCDSNHLLKLKTCFFIINNNMQKLRFYKLFTERSFPGKKLCDL